MGLIFRPILIHDVDIGVTEISSGDEPSKPLPKMTLIGASPGVELRVLSQQSFRIIMRSPTWRCISLRICLITSG